MNVTVSDPSLKDENALAHAMCDRVLVMPARVADLVWPGEIDDVHAAGLHVFGRHGSASQIVRRAGLARVGNADQRDVEAQHVSMEQLLLSSECGRHSGGGG